MASRHREERRRCGHDHARHEIRQDARGAEQNLAIVVERGLEDHERRIREDIALGLERSQ
jgi:hypothetical protein